MNTTSTFIHNAFSRKVIMITGGTGSIGSEIVRQLIQYRPQQIRIYSRDETKHYLFQKELEYAHSLVDIRYLIGDIRDRERLDMALNRVNIVFHAAALKHVPFCEYNPFEAIKTNVNGTQNLVELGIRHNVEKIIAISTDKAVNPNTFMGVTKLLMERMIVSSRVYIGPQSKTRMSVVRFGNVLHSRGSVIPMWIEQIKKGGPVTVTDKEMKRYFMSIPQAVELVLQSGAIMLGQEVFVLKMPEVNIYELAKQTIAQYANGKRIDIEVTGIREREKIREELFTEEEKQLMIDMGQYHIILPTRELFEERKMRYSGDQQEVNDFEDGHEKLLFSV